MPRDRGERHTHETHHRNDCGTTLALAPLLAADKEPAKRLHEAAAVLSEVMAAPDKGIPQELLEKAHCIVIVPELKTAAFVAGGKYGKGYLSCRNVSRRRLVGAGHHAHRGRQRGLSDRRLDDRPDDAGHERTRRRQAAREQVHARRRSSVAAGPVGRTATAQTDAQMHADILSWSRSQGLFAGIALEGATLRQDLDDNTTIYGKRLENREIVRGACLCLTSPSRSSTC